MTTSRGKNDTAERPTNRLRGLNIWAPTCTLFFTFRTKIVGYQRIWPRWRTGKHQEGTETHASRFLESAFTKDFEKGNQHRCYLSGLKQSHHAKTLLTHTYIQIFFFLPAWLIWLNAVQTPHLPAMMSPLMLWSAVVKRGFAVKHSTMLQTNVVMIHHLYPAVKTPVCTVNTGSAFVGMTYRMVSYTV
jgi:hypothetical protein